MLRAGKVPPRRPTGGAARARRSYHTGQVRRFLVLHDTTTFGEAGETPSHRGPWPAVEELLAGGVFRLRQRYANNHGLAVLERA